MINTKDIILFQGDSITDCERDNQGLVNDLSALGQGYAMMIAAELLATMPTADLQCYNRGISGNRIIDLYARIKADFINLRPNVISILIGVNDTMHELHGNNGIKLPKYERLYRELLQEVRSELPTVKFVLCEPFILKCGIVTDECIAEIAQRSVIVARLAKEFNAVFVPFQSMFDEAVKIAPPQYWAADGIHPSPAGHSLMTKAWLQTTGFGEHEKQTRK